MSLVCSIKGWAVSAAEALLDELLKERAIVQGDLFSAGSTCLLRRGTFIDLFLVVCFSRSIVW